MNHYQCHGNVNYGYGSGRLTTLEPAQVKSLDQTIRQHRSATVAELLSTTRFNTTERTIQLYRHSIGYRTRKSVVKVETIIDWNLLPCIIVLISKDTFLKVNVTLV